MSRVPPPPKSFAVMDDLNRFTVDLNKNILNEFWHDWESLLWVYQFESVGTMYHAEHHGTEDMIQNYTWGVGLTFSNPKEMITWKMR